MRLPIGLRAGIGMLAGVGIACLCGLLILIGSAFFVKGEQQLSYIIVLGAQMKPNGPSVVLEKRLCRAYTYLTGKSGDLFAYCPADRAATSRSARHRVMYDALVKKELTQNG